MPLFRATQFRIAAVALWAAAFLAATGTEIALAQAKPPEKSQPKKRKPDPMRVEFVREAPGACTTNCLEWISAEGDITAETPARFAAAFRKAGNRPLPVLLHSYGGSVDTAIAVGRMLRQRKVRVIVARTVFHGCGPKDGPACLKSRNQAHYLGRPADPMPRAICASACPLLLAGGTERASAPGAVIGVHQVINMVTPTRQLYRIHYRMVNGVKREIGRTLISETRGTARRQILPAQNPVYARMRAHLARMGVAGDLVDHALQKGPDDMNWLAPFIVRETALAPLQIRPATFMMATRAPPPVSDIAAKIAAFAGPIEAPGVLGGLETLVREASRRRYLENEQTQRVAQPLVGHARLTIGFRGMNHLELAFEFRHDAKNSLINAEITPLVNGKLGPTSGTRVAIALDGGAALVALRPRVAITETLNTSIPLHTYCTLLAAQVPITLTFSNRPGETEQFAPVAKRLDALTISRVAEAGSCASIP